MNATKTKACRVHDLSYEETSVAGAVIGGCPRCEDERAEAWRRSDRDRELEAATTRWEAKLEAAGIPPRFRAKTLDTYESGCEGQRKALAWARDYASNFADQLASGRSCLLIGKPGTGKTHLAIGVALHVLERGGSAWFGTVQRAVRRVKGTWSRSSNETESHAIASMTKPDLLVLDEVGVQFGSDYEQNLLFDILNERYEHRRPTILLSNLEADAVKNLLGERVLDRMREDGGRVMIFDWPSYRVSGGSHA